MNGLTLGVVYHATSQSVQDVAADDVAPASEQHALAVYKLGIASKLRAAPLQYQRWSIRYTTSAAVARGASAIADVP